MSVIQCFSLFLPRDKLTLKTDAPDGIELGKKGNEEIVRVAQRPKFRKYFPEDAVERLKAWMDTHFSMFEIDGITPRCRDPKDDYLLELAVKSHAIYLVSGDEDLLELEHIEDCKIVTVAQFEAELGE